MILDLAIMKTVKLINMQSMTVSEVKAYFSVVLDMVQNRCNYCEAVRALFKEEKT